MHLMYKLRFSSFFKKMHSTNFFSLLNKSPIFEFSGRPSKTLRSTVAQQAHFNQTSLFPKKNRFNELLFNTIVNQVVSHKPNNSIDGNLRQKYIQIKSQLSCLCNRYFEQVLQEIQLEVDIQQPNAQVKTNLKKWHYFNE